MEKMKDAFNKAMGKKEEGKEMNEKLQVPTQAEADHAKQKPAQEDFPAPVSAELPEDKEAKDIKSEEK